MLGTPCLPVTLNATKGKESKEASTNRQIGITSLSEPVISVFKDHAMLLSIEVIAQCCGICVYYFMV